MHQSRTSMRTKNYKKEQEGNDDATLCYISCLEKSNLTNFYLKLTWFYVKYY